MNCAIFYSSNRVFGYRHNYKTEEASLNNEVILIKETLFNSGVIFTPDKIR